MGCVPCAQRRERRNWKYRWSSGDGEETQVYDTEMAAKAKVMRKGGSYTPFNPDVQ